MKSTEVNTKGQLGEVEYTILKQPEPPAEGPQPKRENPVLDKPVLDSPEQEKPCDEDRLDEIAELPMEAVCSNRKQIRAGGSDFPAEVVNPRLLKLDAEHIRFAEL